MADAQTALVKYVFLDVVDFTKGRSVEAQADVIAQLNQIVLQALTSHQIKDDSRMLIPTGDGMCIALVEISRPFDVHLLLGLEILSLIQKYNASTSDKMRQFEIRIGLNENVDNLITDVNGRPNVAGMGISMAQRIMNLADGGQILVSKSVFDTLHWREKYMSAFSDEYGSEVKHGEVLIVCQYVAKNSPGLNVEEPKIFRVEVKSEKPIKLSKFAAYYMAHSFQNQDFLLSKKDRGAYTYTAASLLYFKASDSITANESSRFESPTMKTWKAGEVSVENQFEYYGQGDFWIKARFVNFFQKELLRSFSQCFEDSDNYTFVNSQGLKKLKEDWPEIAKEFGIQ